MLMICVILEFDSVMRADPWACLRDREDRGPCRAGPAETNQRGAIQKSTVENCPVAGSYRVRDVYKRPVQRSHLFARRADAGCSLVERFEQKRSVSSACADPSCGKAKISTSIAQAYSFVVASRPRGQMRPAGGSVSAWALSASGWYRSICISPAFDKPARKCLRP